MHPASRNALNSYGRQPRSVAPCMELLHSRSRGAAVGSRISSGTLPATFTSAFARCALRFVRWNAPQWSHGMFIALTQSCISWWNGRDSLQLGCRTLQRTCPELLGRPCVATGAEPRCCRRPCVARRLGRIGTVLATVMLYMACKG